MTPHLDRLVKRSPNELLAGVLFSFTRESSYLREQVLCFMDHPFVSGMHLQRSLGQPLCTRVQRLSIVLRVVLGQEI